MDGSDPNKYYLLFGWTFEGDYNEPLSTAPKGACCSQKPSTVSQNLPIKKDVVHLPTPKQLHCTPEMFNDFDSWCAQFAPFRRRRTTRRRLLNVDDDDTYQLESQTALSWLKFLNHQCKTHFQELGYSNWQQGGLVTVDDLIDVNIRREVISKGNCNDNGNACALYLHGFKCNDDNQSSNNSNSLCYWSDENQRHLPHQHEHVFWNKENLPYFEKETSSHLCVADHGFNHRFKKIPCTHSTNENKIKWMCSIPNDAKHVSRDDKHHMQSKISVQQGISINIGTRKHNHRVYKDRH